MTDSREYLSQLESEHADALHRLQGARDDQRAAIAEQQPAETLTAWRAAVVEVETEVQAIAEAMQAVREQLQEQEEWNAAQHGRAADEAVSQAWKEAREAAQDAGRRFEQVLAGEIMPAVRRAFELQERARNASYDAASINGRSYTPATIIGFWPGGMEALLPYLEDFLRRVPEVRKDAAVQAAREAEQQRQREREQDASAREWQLKPVEERNRLALSTVF